MTREGATNLADLWAHHHAQWRDPAQVVSQWRDAALVEARLLEHRAEGAWWETIERLGITLLVTREYEHLVMGLTAEGGRPRVTFLPLPHPSGLVADRRRGLVHIASTRNPNQVLTLAPAADVQRRLDLPGPGAGVADVPAGNPLLPLRARFYPGCLYLHDLALIGGVLHGNAVGMNAVVRLDDDGRFERVWWPRCIDTPRGPVFGQNHLQLNSIAAGRDLAASYFSASCAEVSRRRPGHRDFPVDQRGVIFRGATRDVLARGLTRPHSARLIGGRLWVDNSGYGEVGVIEGERFTPLRRLPGWTRGLCGVAGNTAGRGVLFVGTSRILPRFEHYAPGLDPARSVCGVHAIDMRSGAVLGSMIWPHGNQIFALDFLPRRRSAGFPFAAGAHAPGPRVKRLFYAGQTFKDRA